MESDNVRDTGYYSMGDEDGWSRPTMKTLETYLRLILQAGTRQQLRSASDQTRRNLRNCGLDPAAARPLRECLQIPQSLGSASHLSDRLREKAS